jgi:hypothetical protein
MNDVPPPIPLSQSENWKKIAAANEKRYHDELIRWSDEKTRLLASIQMFSTDNDRLKAENIRLKAENNRLKGVSEPKTSEKLKF